VHYRVVPGLTLECEIIIPKRVQKEVYPIGRGYSLGTERFHLRANFDTFPITLVSPIDDESSEFDGSRAVMIVREFLQRELRVHGSKAVLAVLGPSPAHVDVLLEPSVESEPALQLLRAEKVGYWHLRCSYSTTHFPGPETARDAFFDQVCPELTLLYQTNDELLRRRNRDAALEATTQEIVELHRERGLRGAWRRTVRGGRKLNDAFIALSEYEISEARSRRRATSEFERIYGDGPSHDSGSRLLRDYVSEEVRRPRPEVPVQQYGELFRLFESRRLSRTEVLVVASSALGGGTVGAVLTAALT
jgi:hypothetical protein